MMTVKHTFLIGIALLSLSTAPVASAYLTPEDVLLNKELYLPPTKREGGERITEQSRISAERRAREQEVIFGAQKSSEVSSVENVLPAAPAEGSAAMQGGVASDEDLRLIQTLRLLDRVDRNQNILLYGNRMLPMQVDAMHGGAPLAPTGAGGILSAITMVGAVGWTMLRAKRAKAVIG